MRGVCGELKRCRTPDNQELFEGLIAKVFAKLPDDFTEAEHEKTLRANGLCKVRCIKRLTEKILGDLGINMGDPMMIMDVLKSGRCGAAGELRSSRSGGRNTRCW